MQWDLEKKIGIIQCHHCNKWETFVPRRSKRDDLYAWMKKSQDMMIRSARWELRINGYICIECAKWCDAQWAQHCANRTREKLANNHTPVDGLRLLA